MRIIKVHLIEYHKVRLNEPDDKKEYGTTFL
jgi:hypothetical protein